MDEPADILKNFQEILSQNTRKEPLALYKDYSNENKRGFQVRTSCSVKDVISKVSKQIKAIQKADIPSASRPDRKKLAKYKKSTFLPVNMLPRDVEVPVKPVASKFETQFVSDTQLINLVDNAEALVHNNGITQEFDCTFSQTDVAKIADVDDDKNDCKENNNVIEGDDESTKNEPDLFHKDERSAVVVDDENDLKIKTASSEIDNFNVNTIQNDLIKFVDRNKNVNEDNAQLNDNCTEILNQCIEIEANLKELDTEEDDVEIQPSLVFEAKKAKTPSPLVFDLGTFEDFEKIAVPIIEENTDIKSAKQLIHSQILGKELFIQTKIPLEVSPKKEELSPVLKISTERLKITKTEHTKIDLKDNSNKHLIPIEINKDDGTFLKDEILFSSDEENEYLHKEFHDIPLTCALETSFYEQPNMLDKTMYVGFQTASNRSIQISRESFTKAQSILDGTEKEISSKLTLTDLVECLSVKKSCDTTKMDSKTTETNRNLEQSGCDNVVEKEIDNLKQPEKRKFEGFVTASRKKIRLSDMALARCKRVFQDIDIDVNYGVENGAEIKRLISDDVKEYFILESCSKSVDESEKTTDKLEMNPQIDEDILQEFDNDMALINDKNGNEVIQSDDEMAQTRKFFDSIDFSDSVLRDDDDCEITEKVAAPDNSFNQDYLLKPKSDSNFELIGFKTASNNDIIISSKALDKAKILLQDINICEDNEIADKSVFYVEDINKPSTSKFCGFKTASNKIINVSNEALMRSKGILQDIISNLCESDHTNQANSTNNNSVEKEIKNLNEVQNSDGNLGNNSEHNLRELDDDFNEVFNTELLEIEKKHTLEHCGFKTASNKPVIISVKDLSQSKHVFKDLGVDDDLSCDNEKLMEFPTMLKKCKTDVDMKLQSDKLSESESFGRSTFDIINMYPIPINLDAKKYFTGFRTASTKTIKIPSEALAKSKEFFKDIEENVDSIPEKDIGNGDTVPQFKGFQTGNNKPIAISDKALAKSKEIFKDIDVISNNVFVTVESTNIKSFQGFKTANNKPIEISAKSLAQSKEIFKGIDKDDLDTNPGENHSAKPFTGFQTASKKPVTISSQALAKSKEIFKDIDINTQNVLNDGFKRPVPISAQSSKDIFKNKGCEVNDIVDINHSKSKDNIPFMGFQTASNKSVTISAEAIAKSKALFKDIDNDYDVTEEDSKKSNDFGFQGFQTARKKPVNISANVLAKSKAIFKDIGTEIGQDIFEENNDWEHNFEFKGFQTASKKPVSISEEAMAKSKALFKDIQETSIIENVAANKHGVPEFVGFQTASKKPVIMSEDALAKSKALFKDIDESSITECDIAKKNDVPEFTGFQTASKKSVKISEDALAKSKALFKDIDQESNIERNKHNKTIFKGFETASKKPNLISEDALAKSRALFRDIHVEKIDQTNMSNETKFKGFETASKKPVLISKEALAKSKDFFKDIDNEINLNETPAKSGQFIGFHTASEKTVEVSKEALVKSKRIFDDVNSFKDTPFRGFETASNKQVKISEEALKKSRQIFDKINNLTDDCKENLENCKDNITQQFKATSFGFQTGNNNEIKISEKAFKDSRKLLKESLKPKILDKSKTGSVYKDDIVIEKLIDTQLINYFEQTLNTEDFCKDTTPEKSKRSGSPILSCPKAKKRKFNTPYRNNEKTPTINTKIAPKRSDLSIFNEHQRKKYKKTKRYTLKDLAKLEDDSRKLNPDPYIVNFNMDDLNFEFDGQRNDITDGKFTIEDLKDYFLGLVNKKLVPVGWLDIQLKLILWKLISYEVKFTKTLNKVCTAKNVIEQLKYRYDRELYNVERPVLRKILEKDDIASKSMVLCVAGIIVEGVKVYSVTNVTSNVELLLTDGWYFIKALMDKMLTKLVYDKRITIGCKLVINGAELMNCDQGIAPWEDTSSVRLKISGNCTRRARWDARLGRHGNAAILTPLSSVKPEGGKVSKLRLYVTRVYPMLYVEKFEDGSTVTRSERLENIHQIKYEADRQTTMEKLYEEVEKELSDQESQDSEGSQLKNRKLYGSMITESQTKSLEEKSIRKREKLLLDIQERVRKKIEDKGLNVGRNVVTLLKIRVADVDEKNGVVVTKGFMSIWKPNDMLTEIINEDSWIEVMNVVPTAVKYSEIHLSAGRQTIFNKSKFKENDKIKPYLNTLARKCYPVADLAQNPTMTTEYNEIDTVGFIFQIDEESSKQPFQNMYLSDGENNIICVNFWGGLRKFGFQNVLDTGQIIACTNLQKRAGNTRKTIPQFRVTEFTFFTKTPKSLVARNMIVEIENKLNGLDKRKYCEECIKLKNNYSSRCMTENVSPYRFNDLNLTKNKTFIVSPLVAKRENFLNLTGLDFESTFQQTENQELSPKSKERKKKVNEKIARLKMIGEPPPLSPMNIINKSKKAFGSYKSPLAQPSVASPNKSAEIGRNYVQSSPIIQMNRTYVRNVNPVKLNFSNAQENSFDEVDHFAEEFDGSPPLSLE